MPFDTEAPAQTTDAPTARARPASLTQCKLLTPALGHHMSGGRPTLQGHYTIGGGGGDLNPTSGVENVSSPPAVEPNRPRAHVQTQVVFFRPSWHFIHWQRAGGRVGSGAMGMRHVVISAMAIATRGTGCAPFLHNKLCATIWAPVCTTTLNHHSFKVAVAMGSIPTVSLNLNVATVYLAPRNLIKILPVLHLKPPTD